MGRKQHICLRSGTKRPLCFPTCSTSRTHPVLFAPQKVAQVRARAAEARRTSWGSAFKVNFLKCGNQTPQMRSGSLIAHSHPHLWPHLSSEGVQRSAPPPEASAPHGWRGSSVQRPVERHRPPRPTHCSAALRAASVLDFRGKLHGNRGLGWGGGVSGPCSGWRPVLLSFMLPL